MEQVLMLSQRFQDFLHSGINYTSHLVVNHAGCFFTYLFSRKLGNLGLKIGGGLSLICDCAQIVGHSVDSYHTAGNVGGSLQIVLRSCGDVMEDNEFRSSSSQEHVDLLQEFLSGHEISIFRGQLQSESKSAYASRHDGDLMNFFRCGPKRRYQRMPRFVISNGFLFFFIQPAVSLFQTGSYENK